MPQLKNYKCYTHNFRYRARNYKPQQRIASWFQKGLNLKTGMKMMFLLQF